jgi:hypothetical protein
MERQIEVTPNTWVTVSSLTYHFYKGNKRILKDITHLKN